MDSDLKTSILVVDDSPANLVTVESILEGLGQNLVMARSGKEALRCLQDQNFAAILLDVMMPEMDGFETAAAIRRRDRSSRTPILFLTEGSSNDLQIARGYALEAVDYLFKPLVPEILIAKVTAFVELYQVRMALERRNAQLELARQSVERESSFKSEFLANMSHELRTPLNAIIGYSGLLEEEVEEQPGSALLPDIRKINAAGKHLLGLINDILDLSKIEAGKVDLCTESFPVAAMIEDTVATVKPLIQKNANKLEVRNPEGGGVMLGDFTKIRQSLLHLVGNAAKFTSEGTITLSIERRDEGGRPWIWFRVADTGIGMTPDQMARVFQPFTQARSDTSRKYGGTGLGLAITKNFCQLMGGDVTVTSCLGQGSTFTMRLPVDGSEAEAAPATTSSESHTERHRVRVVGDKP